MKLSLNLNLLLFPILLMLCSCCQETAENGFPPELETAIGDFYASVESGDVETRIGLFANEAIIMPNHWTVYRGIEDISTMLRAGEGWVFKIRDRKVIDRDVSRDIAYTVNSYFYTWHAADGEPQWHKTKNVHIWKKDAEGSWKLHVDIWNSDVPMSQFPEE